VTRRASGHWPAKSLLRLSGDFLLWNRRGKAVGEQPADPRLSVKWPSTQFVCACAVLAGLYYKMDGPEKLARFLEDAEKYVAPQAPYALPPPELLPRRRSAAEAKQMFPKPIELRGYCPVTFLEGKCRSVNSSKHIQQESHSDIFIFHNPLQIRDVFFPSFVTF